jgi:hypothetical protein
MPGNTDESHKNTEQKKPRKTGVLTPFIQNSRKCKLICRDSRQRCPSTRKGSQDMRESLGIMDTFLSLIILMVSLMILYILNMSSLHIC